MESWVVPAVVPLCETVINRSWPAIKVVLEYKTGTINCLINECHIKIRCY